MCHFCKSWPPAKKCENCTKIGFLGSFWALKVKFFAHFFRHSSTLLCFFICINSLYIQRSCIYHRRHGSSGGHELTASYGHAISASSPQDSSRDFRPDRPFRTLWLQAFRRPSTGTFDAVPPYKIVVRRGHGTGDPTQLIGRTDFAELPKFRQFWAHGSRKWPVLSHFQHFSARTLKNWVKNRVKNGSFPIGISLFRASKTLCNPLGPEAESAPFDPSGSVPGP